MKQAQISVFILTGIMILLAVGIFVMMQTEYIMTEQSVNQKAVQQYVQSCFEPAAYDAIYLAGLQEGYIESRDSVSNPAREQYYYYYYNDISPNLTIIYQNMELYIINHTLECLHTIALPYNISFDENSVSVEFSASDSETTVVLNMLVTIVEQNTVSTLSTFTTTVSASFEKEYAIARQITKNIAASDPLVCMSCLQEIAETQNVFLSITEYEELSDVYILTDSSMQLYGAPYTFAFKIRSSEDYDLTPFFEQQNPLVLELASYNATAGQEFFLNINTDDFLQHVVPQFVAQSGYSLTFSDFTSLFDIDPILGIITFTPTEQQKGTHNMLLKIEDNTGNIEYTTLVLVIQ